MNILFYSSVPTVRYGGVARWARQMVRSLREMGHRVHILTWGHIPPDEAQWGPDLHFQPLDPRIAGFPLARFWHPLLAAARVGRQVIAQHEIQIIHTTAVYETYSASLARGSGPAAIVLSIHGDFVTEQDEWWKSRWRRRLYRPLERSAFRNCEAVTTSSSWLQDRLAAQAGRTHTAVIPNGIAVPQDAACAPDQQTPLLPKDKRIILTLNNLFTPQRRQGLKLLIAAAPTILEQVPDALFLVGGGVNDPVRDRKSLEWARQQSGTLPFVYTGHRSRSPDDLMAMADVYVHPSFLDNSPTSVMEAMILHKPIVATQVGGIPELISNGDTGLLVPLEPEALADAVVRLLQDRSFAQTLGNNAHQKALLSFTWTRVGEQFTQLYEKAFCSRAKATDAGQSSSEMRHKAERENDQG